jgi:hypothetical protein
MSSEHKNIETHFYSTYGKTNEIKYIADYIEKNKIPFGDVNIIYSSDSYNNYLMAELGARKIPYAMITPYSALKFYSMNLLTDLLAWVEQNYSYAALSDVFRNKYMTLGYEKKKSEKDNEHKDDNPKWTSPFNMLVKGLRDDYKIGWGLKRYTEYAEVIRKKISDFETEKGLKVEDGNPDIAYNDKGYKTADHEAEKILHRELLANLDKKRFANCLDEIAKPFLKLEEARTEGKKVSPYELWSALYVAFKKILRSNHNTEWAVLKGGLDEVEKAVELSKEDVPFDVAVQELKKELENITVSDAEKSDKVSVIHLKRPMTLDRKYNFFIGLSAVDFGVNNTESPVLSDDELRRLIDDSAYIRFGKDAEKERRAYYNKTLDSISEGKVFFGYSYYDVLNMRENSESAWLIECRENYGVEVENVEKINEIECLAEKLNMKDDDLLEIVNDEEYMESLKELHEEQLEKAESEDENAEAKIEEAEDEEIEFEYEEDEEDEEYEDYEDYEYDDVEEYEEEDVEYEYENLPVFGPYNFSATSAKTLINCPLGYKYEKVDYIPKEEFYDIKPGEWLNAADKGTLVHAVLEEYCNKVLKGNKNVAGNIDEVAFENIFAEKCEEVGKKYPPVSEKAHERAKNIYEKALRGYLERLHKELSDPNSNWVVYGCELKFGGNSGIDVTYSWYNGKLAGCEDDYDEYGYEELPDEYSKNPSGTYVVSFEGSIDRVDVWEKIEKNEAGEDVSVKHFRIVDYKTVKNGEKLKRECEYFRHKSGGRDFKMPVTIQHNVYAIALKNMYPDAKIDEVVYECLMDDKCLQVRYPDDISLGGAGEDTKKVYRQWMHEELCELPPTVRLHIEKTVGTKNFTPKNLEKKKDIDDRCRYCTYKDMCPEWLGKEL